MAEAVRAVGAEDGLCFARAVIEWCDLMAIRAICMPERL